VLNGKASYLFYIRNKHIFVYWYFKQFGKAICFFGKIEKLKPAANIEREERGERREEEATHM
jgi:hypothetical protein